MIFLLLVLVIGVSVYTFINRDYLNHSVGARFQAPDEVQEDLATPEPQFKIKRDQATSSQILPLDRIEQDTRPLEHTPHITFQSPFSDETKERKYDIEGDPQDDESTDSSGDEGGILVPGIPEPHRHGSPMFNKEQKDEKTENSSKQQTWNTSQLEKDKTHENRESEIGKFLLQPRKPKDTDSYSDALDKKPNIYDNKNDQKRKQNDKKISVLQRLLDDKSSPSDLHPYTICPFLGLRKSSTSTIKSADTKCKVKTFGETSCKEAYVAYHTDQEPLQCEKIQEKNMICWYDKKQNIHCDMRVCEEKFVYLASVDSNYGIVRPSRNSKIPIGSNKHLEQILYHYAIINKRNGFNFCFLKCKSSSTRNRFIEQLVMFPPTIPKTSSALDKRLININILLLDSVSRPHFYRSMHKSVQTLRKIVHDPKINATVLDFELFQSMADYTFHNIRVFMSGKTDFDYKQHKEQHYEIEYLYKHLKSKGYHTILQEDSCWYDEWGSLYTDNLFQGKKPENLKDFKIRWKKFKKKIKQYYIDDYGLSHFSCEALERYNITNQFNQPKKICFGGKVFAEYFIDYNERVFNDSIRSKTPILAYTHLNTGHEVSGTRIKQIDKRLSDFFLNMAEKENTLTLVFSDHGPKTTRYAFRTMSGRAEIYDSLMFAIVPEKVASILGNERTKALITNQKRLITAFDLHNTFMSIGDSKTENSYKNEGIFTEISPNRTCGDVPIKDSAICKCDGWDEFFATNHRPFIWLAELALGTLNNRIQNEYITGKEGSGGFGKCQRLIGKRFEKIRRRTIGNKYKVTMDLIVNPEDEIFEVQVEYPVNPGPLDNDVQVTHLSRISIYRRFEKCKDNNVDITHCVCRSRKNTPRNRWISMNTRKNLLRILTRSENFGAKVKFSDLHASCLVMVTRTHSARVSVFEIANACTNRLYRVKVSGKSRGKAITSTSFPITLKLQPLTVHFLFSVYHLEKPYGFKATTSYKAYFVDQSMIT
ncbi:hypothetical protein AC249_AIPGENE5929 [Exaiptasia diaphana]|nr:hypothetical protein AC249_AIPGENE5929 [Exaiptasia diaphana]